MTSGYENIDEKTFQGMCQYYDHIPLGVCIIKYIEIEKKGFDFQTIYVNELFEDIVDCPKALLYNMTLKEFIKTIDDSLYSMFRYAAIADIGFEEELYLEKLGKYIKLRGSQYKPGYALIFSWDSSKENAEAKKLKETNDILHNRMRIIHSLSTIYYASYQIDLLTGMAYEVESLDKIRKYIPQTCVAQDGLYIMCDKLIISDYNNEMRSFVDLSTIKQRMKDKNIISHEFIGFESGWSRGSFVSAMRDDNGEVTQILYVAQHIDEEKQRELDYQRELEAAVVTAKKANEARSRFLASMSHDIRTPINGIIGLIDMEKENHCHDKKLHDEHMRKIRISAEQLLSIMNDVLEMSKLENGADSVCEEEFSLDELIEGIKSFPIEKNVKLNIDYSKIVYNRIIGSPAHIRQILFHTVGNAIKYSEEEGQVTVTITSGGYINHKMEYIFTISDSGIGMSQSFMKHIFEPFTQEHGGARTKYEGTGLGMAIVKRLVDELDGSIEIKSEVDVGTTVTIRIPLLLADDDIINKSDGDNENEIDISGMHALIVEDNEINAEITQFILEEADVTVTIVENGKEAVDAFNHSNEGEFDMILMDIMMPVMNGLEATRTIRALDRADAQSVPIIAVTANTFPEDVKRSYEAGMDGHIGKPIDTENVLHIIKKYIKQKWDKMSH